MPETVGILGAGTVGRQLARYLLDSGNDVVLSNNHGPASLAETIAELGERASAGTAEQAAGHEIVILAVPWPSVESVLTGLNFDGQILIDATNAIKLFDPPKIELFEFGDSSSSEEVQRLATGARVVKAFSSRMYPLPAVPDQPDERFVFFFSGDDSGARARVAELLSAIGFAPIDLGTLAIGGRVQQVGGPLAGLDLRLAG